MKFSILRENLLNALQMVIGAVEKRQTMPILSNVLLKVFEKKIQIVATDLEVQLQVQVDLITTDKDIETTVSARKLLDICRALPENTVLDFFLKEAHLEVKCEHSRFKLALLDAENFPNVKIGINQHEFSLPQKQLRYLIEKVYFSMAQQDVRYYLNGIYFNKTIDGLTTVAADGHRLAICSYKNDFPGQPLDCIVPRKAIIELLRLLENSEENVLIQIGENHFTVKGENYQFISKLIESNFPDYHKLIPKNANHTLLIDKEQIKQMLVRIAILSSEKYRGVILRFEPNKFIVESHNSEHEEAYEETSLSHSINNFQIGFNVNYLLDAINALPDSKIILSLTDNHNSPLLIEAEEKQEILYVVMPMRI